MRTGDHIPPEMLMEYAEGRAAGEARRQVEGHLQSGCARCRAELAVWTRSLAALQAGELPAPPEHVLRRAANLVPAAPPRESWTRTVARLLFDSRSQPAPAGVRDVSDEMFQLLFDADDTEIDLLCEREEETWRITGQAVGPEVSGSWQAEAAGPAGSAAAPLTDEGEFRLFGLPCGVYGLSLRSEEGEILLPGVRLDD